MQRFSTRSLATTALFALAGISAVGCSSSSDDDFGTSQQAIVARPAARLFLTSPVLSRLKTRAAAGDAAWTALKAQCEGLTTATMNAPNGDAYPSRPNVGQGYQGEEYVSPVMALGLCYRVTSGTDDAAAARYGAAGGRLLDAISTPEGSGGQRPSTDSGYGIRNYGFAMAMGFDWLYPALSPSTKSQVVGTLNTWIDWYDQAGFLRNDSIGNYFIGYFLAKTTAALATEGENPNAAKYFADVETRMWQTLVKPAFAKNMAGGGWPEGWGYGPRAVRGLAEVLWAVKTARNLDWATELPQMKEQATYLNYFAWPSLKHMDDIGTVRSGTSIAPSAALSTSLAMIMEYMGDPAAADARGFAADVLANNGKDDRAPWQSFLYWDGSLPAKSYTTRPLSYVAKGPGHVAMRSNWNKDATWGTLMSGTYINAADSGEQLFNQGSLAIVRGDRPLLVNASGWIPQVANTAGENFVYDDAWGSKTRKLYNTFFVADPTNLYSPGQASTGPGGATTTLERVDQQGGFVRARAANVEEMYRPRSGSTNPVKQFTRDLVYLRPGTFVLFDRTTVTNAGSDAWMSFHTATAPTTVGVSDSTQRRFDVTAGGAPLGSVRMLLPRGASTNVVALPGGVARIEAHDPARAATQQWLTVVTAADQTPEQTRLSATDNNVLAGGVTGVHVRSAQEQVVLFPGAQADTAQTSNARYVVQQSADAQHVLVDIAPSTSGYGVSVTGSNGAFTVDVHTGGSMQPSAHGSLSFVVSANGAVAGVAATANPPAPTSPTSPTPTSPTPVTPTSPTDPTKPSSNPRPRLSWAQIWTRDPHPTMEW